jgi:dihydropteroate synthase
MGILNLTPDSFSDGGLYNTPDAAYHRTEQMLAEGADIIDVGGYSSRPGAAHISEAEELKRLADVVPGILQRFPQAVVSIDTFRNGVAAEMLAAGAHVVNDISGGSLDANMFATAARFGAPYVLMHMQGTPQTMQQNPVYGNVVDDVWHYFVQHVNAARATGLHDIVLDPGFGFGKTVEHNYALLRNLHVLKQMGLPLLAGISKKSMLTKALNLKRDEVLPATSALHFEALRQGTSILRVHDVAAAKQVADIFTQTYPAGYGAV